MQSLKKHKISDSEKEKILEKIIDNLKDEDSIIFAYSHGSFLEGSFRDIDLAIYVQTTLNKKEALKLELKLERELEEKIKLPIDIRILNYSPLSFRYNVIKDGKLILSRNENLRCDFASLSIREYLDFNFYRKRYMKEVLGLEV
jgi:hypothetical protein